MLSLFITLGSGHCLADLSSLPFLMITIVISSLIIKETSVGQRR